MSDLLRKHAFELSCFLPAAFELMMGVFTGCAPNGGRRASLLVGSFVQAAVAVHQGRVEDARAHIGAALAAQLTAATY
jgi:hypothetical protein